MGRGDSSWQDRNHHIGNSRGGTGSNETYDSSKGSKAVSTTAKKHKSSIKVNSSGAGGTGRNIV